MSKTVTCTILALIATLAGFLPGGFALGSVGSGQAVVVIQKPAVVTVSTRKNRSVSSYYAQVQADLFARLAPVDHDDGIDFSEATALLNDKTLNEKIFNKDFESKMRGEYAGRVSPTEKAATNPIWRPSSYAMKQYDDSRHDLAQWTTREVMEDQLKDFFAHGDRSSPGMKALSTARALTGGGDDEKPAEKPLTPEEKIARAHRTDIPQKDEEPAIPTKLKTKMNVLRQNASVVFLNPIATTSVNGNKDDVSVDMNHDFHKLTMKSRVAYTMKDECLNVNVNKKITDHVSLDLDHYTYTGDKRDGAGYKVREQARVNYSIGF